MKACTPWLTAGFLLLCLCVVPVLASDAPAVEWQNLLGGNNWDFGKSIQKTADGGYILTGSTHSDSSGDVGVNHGGQDVWVVKLNSAGTLQWQKVLGGRGDEEGNSILQASDGGYTIAGYTTSSLSGDVGENHGGKDVWVVKLNSTGTLQWQKVLGGSGDEEGNSILQALDNGYILTGSTTSSNSGDVGGNHGGEDVWVVKLTSSGDPDWQKVLGGSKDEVGESIRRTGDGGYILTGTTQSSRSGDVQNLNHGEWDIWVVKLTASGATDWQRVYGGTGTDVGYSIAETILGGYILTGQTDSNNSGDVGPSHGDYDVWVVQLGSSGIIGWQYAYGGNGYDRGYSISQTSDKGYILTGSTSSNQSGDVGLNHGGRDAWVVKLTSSGDPDWQKVLGGEYDDDSLSLQKANDGGYILAGFTYSSDNGDVGHSHGSADVWVVKLEKPLKPLPSYTKLPTDPDNDGIYEDLNGNGRLDFADVVLYFNQMTWIAGNEPITAFDLNGNGRIDFADIVALFNEI
jgi:PKD repeat protein